MVTNDKAIEAIEALKGFKDGYDNMEPESIASMFQGKVKFQGTAEKEYRDAGPQDVAQYFQKIATQRSAQEVELVSVEQEGESLSVDAIFHSHAKDGEVNPDKAVHFDIVVGDDGKISEFKSQPREEPSEPEVL